MAVSLDQIVSLCKRRGFVFQASEIYGGFESTWDYGPLGVELKRRIADAWWRDTVLAREDVVGLDSAILQAPKRLGSVSGHVGGFNDPMVDCKVVQGPLPRGQTPSRRSARRSRACARASSATAT